MGRLCSQIANYFPLWLVLGCGVALWKPAALNFMSRDHVSAGLAVTMLAMGMTLSTEVGSPQSMKQAQQLLRQ